MCLAIAPIDSSSRLNPTPALLAPTTRPHHPDRCDILIVDPEPDIRQIVQTSLEVTTPWSVTATHSYAAGAKLAFSLSPRVLLLNLPLGAVPRSHYLRPFQQLVASQNIHWVVMVDRVRPSDRQHLLDCGIDGIIAKPFDCDQLVALLSQWLD
ncbi:response regulator [Spirulina sp. CCNP1310]|uniref:response regulator n=1 Tax=Spirulina sp. CCNP1310 TaxID=3110249 RepID=UPI002B1F6A90|nr:response regulator [Spirulina sp. CCNP1310]MEA5417755.1 response regulator [Spirulina sp. CCNP1310]